MPSYLNAQSLDRISDESFQTQRPYPWINIPGTLMPEGWDRLRESLPDISLFKKWVGVKRSHGQASHDRAILHYPPKTEVAQPWRQFIAELEGEYYQWFIRRLFGLPPSQRFILTMEWYYAWQGCSVSPHCDARRKLGTHIFYFNTEAEWDESWGGRILIMDDRRRFNAHSAPGFDRLQVAASLDARGNQSLLFRRTAHSWHGVKPIESPPDVLRKLFIVTINVPTLQVWWRHVRGKDPDGYAVRI